MLKHGILGLINYHEMTGYEIMQTFRDSLNFFWNAQTSQIYRELQTLEKKEWVNKTVVEQQGKPDKNVYSITEEGRAELLRWLGDGNLGLNERTPVLMKVFFMGERSREENIRCFEELKAYYGMFLESLATVPESIEAYSAYIDNPEKALYWGMTVELGRRNLQTYMEWAQDCINILKGKGLKKNSDELFFQPGICVKTSQIPLIAEQNLRFCSRPQRGTHRSGGADENFSDKRKSEGR